MKKFFTLLVVCVLLLPPDALAWSGVDSDTGEEIEIGKGNLVRSGKTIEIYEVDKDEYKEVDVESIERVGNVVEVEVFDWEENQYRTFEMEDD